MVRTIEPLWNAAREPRHHRELPAMMDHVEQERGPQHATDAERASPEEADLAIEVARLQRAHSRNRVVVDALVARRELRDPR